MANEIQGLSLGFIDAASDLSSNQFYAVKHTSSGIALAGAGEPADGILQNDPNADVANVMHQGVSKAVIGAAVADGALLMSNAAGKLITATSTNNVIAKALEAGGADAQIITVLISKQGVLP